MATRDAERRHVLVSLERPTLRGRGGEGGLRAGDRRSRRFGHPLPTSGTSATLTASAVASSSPPASPRLASLVASPDRRPSGNVAGGASGTRNATSTLATGAGYGLSAPSTLAARVLAPHNRHRKPNRAVPMTATRSMIRGKLSYALGALRREPA